MVALTTANAAVRHCTQRIAWQGANFPLPAFIAPITATYP